MRQNFRQDAVRSKRQQHQRAQEATVEQHKLRIP